MKREGRGGREGGREDGGRERRQESSDTQTHIRVLLHLLSLFILVRTLATPSTPHHKKFLINLSLSLSLSHSLTHSLSLSSLSTEVGPPERDKTDRSQEPNDGFG